jgi:hypothetical protein
MCANFTAYRENESQRAQEIIGYESHNVWNDCEFNEMNVGE